MSFQGVIIHGYTSNINLSNSASAIMTTNNNNSSNDGSSVAVQDNDKDNPFAEYMWMREEDEFNKEAS